MIIKETGAFGSSKIPGFDPRMYVTPGIVRY
jgi:hypothetical protein